jgi:hypothetical protein
MLQRRKRDAYDHDIEHHHDLSGARHSQDKPPLPGRCTQSHDSTLPHQTGKRAILVAGTSRDEMGSEPADNASP